MYAQTNLPVPDDRVDQSTFNPNLPSGNDCWPQINIPRTIDIQAVNATVAYLRMAAQTRATKTPLHAFVYNMFSNNYFNNPVFADWCQKAVNFTEFLILAQNNQPLTAAEKSALKMYVAALAFFGGQYPMVAQKMPQDQINMLGAANNEFMCIQQDLQAFNMRRQQMGQNQMYGAPQQQYNMTQQLAPINTTLQQYAVNQQPSYTPPAAQLNTMNTVSGNSGRGTAMYLDQNPGKPVPTSWDANNPTGTTQQSAPPQQQTPVIQEIDMEDPNLKAPSSIDEIIMDPYAYTPAGFVVDVDRKFDELRAPGGVVIKPAFKSGWERTPGDDQPYSVLYDPNNYIMFHVRWPDGVVKEKLVEYTPEMEYIRHEINEQLQSRARKPQGKMVMSTTAIVDVDQEPVNLNKVREEMDEGLDVTKEMAPVILPVVLTNSTDLENEIEARRIVKETLGLEDSDPVPAHEYTSIKFHALDVSKECSIELTKLSKATKFGEVADRLRELLDEGILSIRYFRFINNRLSDAVNAYLNDNLSEYGVICEGFVEDIDSICQWLGTKRSYELRRVFEESAPTIFQRSLTVSCEQEEADSGVEYYGITDEYVNFQLGLSEADLLSLNIEKEPVLLSRASHPRIYRVVSGMIRRAAENETIKRAHMRVITSDGVYVEVIRGKLAENAVLLKRL